MKYSIDDIQIFILTNKRKNYLKKMLDSVLFQSVCVKEIFVMDNDSTDNIKDFLPENINTKVHHIKTTGADGNYLKLLELADRKYMMVLHDDDILHPFYLERVLRYLNSDIKEEPVLIGCGYQTFENENEIIRSSKKQSKYLICKNSEFFTNAVYLNYCRFCYPSAVFKTDVYKQNDNRLLMQIYGKLADFFVLTNVAKCGDSVILLDNMYYKRIHQLSDSNNMATAVTEKQYYNVISELSRLTDKFYYFSASRLYAIFKDYYRYTNLKEEFVDYFQKFSINNEQLFTNKTHKCLKYVVVYQSKHKSIFHYINYLLKVKLMGKRNTISKDDFSFIKAEDTISL